MRLPSSRAAVLGAAALSAAVVLAGCSSSSSTSAPAPTTASASAVQGPGLSPTAAAPTSPQRVDVTTFASVVGEPGVTVIDVRTPQEYAAGHIEGAVNIDVESADFADRVSELDPKGTYAVYCRSGNRSATAVGIMAGKGITGTYDLDGGIVAWEAAGQPVVT